MYYTKSPSLQGNFSLLTSLVYDLYNNYIIFSFIVGEKGGKGVGNVQYYKPIHMKRPVTVQALIGFKN